MSNRRVTIRDLTGADDPRIATVIRRVLEEFEATGWGTSEGDAEIDNLSRYYAQPGAGYFVGEIGGVIVGGGGYAPLAGGPADTVEIQKMYLLPEGRGHGIGRAILTRSMTEVRALAYRVAYLETMSTMHTAHALYRTFGFRPLDGPMGATGHSICDRFFSLALDRD